ncbi:MAG: hypothetical protein ACOX17_00490 [Christensenellales bacterium]
MKKLSVIITALLLVFLLGACSLLPAGLLPFKNYGPTEAPIISAAKDPSEAEDSAPIYGTPVSKEPASDDPEPDMPDADAPALEAPVLGEITFNGLVVIEGDEGTITITAIEPDNEWGYTLKVLLENSSSVPYILFTEDGAVDGVACDMFLFAEVAPGEALEQEIHIDRNELQANGLTLFTDIELTFKIFDSYESTEPVAQATAHVYPYGEENARVFDRENQPTDIVLFDDENVTVIVTGSGEDPDWGYFITLYLVNKTDLTLLFMEDNAFVNGCMTDPYWSKELRPGKRAFSPMYWSIDAFAENGITEVKEIGMLFSVFDSYDWEAEKLIEKLVTFSP